MKRAIALVFLVLIAFPSLVFADRLITSGIEQNTLTNVGEINTSTGTVSVESTIKRSGSYSLKSNPTTATGYINMYTTPNLTTGGTWYATFYLYLPSSGGTPSTKTQIFRFATGSSTYGGGIAVTTSDTLQLTDGSNFQVTGTSDSAALSKDTWHKIEVSYAYSNAVVAKLDGTQFASGSASASRAISNVLVGVQDSATATMYFDDIAVNNSLGSCNTGFPQGGNIVYLRPNATGDSAGWSTTGTCTGGHYGCVNEITPDSTNYVYASAANATEMWNVEDLGVSAATINYVGVSVRYNRSSSNPSKFKAQIEKEASGTKAQSAEYTPSSTTITDNGVASHINAINLCLDPDGSAWTPTTINSAQIGVIISTQVTNQARVHTEFMVVDYTPMIVMTMSGGGIGGGEATITPEYQMQTLQMSMSGGGIAGGDVVYFKGMSPMTMTGGGIVGGEATYSFVGLQSIIMTMGGGAIAGGDGSYGGVHGAGLSLVNFTEIGSVGMSSGTSTRNFVRTKTLLNSNDYDGNATWYFEVVATNNDIADRTVYLMAGDVERTSITVAGSSSAPTRYRTSSFVPPNGDIEFWIRMDGSNTAGQFGVSISRIIIEQTNATKTRIQIPMGDSNSSTIGIGSGDDANEDKQTTSCLEAETSPNWDNNGHNLIWHRDSSLYSDLSVVSNAWTFEVTSYGGSGLKNTLWDTTSNSIISSTTITHSDSGQWERQSINISDAQFGVPDGHDVVWKFQCSTLNTELVSEIRLYLKLGNLSKAELIARVGKQTNSGMGASHVIGQRGLVDLSKFTSPKIYFETTGLCNTTDAFTELWQSDADSGTTGSAVTNSQIVLNSGSVVRTRSGQLTLSGSHRYHLHRLETSVNCSENDSFLIIQADNGRGTGKKFIPEYIGIGRRRIL